MLSQLKILGHPYAVAAAAITTLLPLAVQADGFGPIPFIDVDLNGRGVRLRAPFVRVETGRQGTSVRTPFADYRSRNYRFPYENVDVGPVAPVPADAPGVEVELNADVRVIVPEGRTPAAAGPDIGVPQSPDIGLGAPAPVLGPSTPNLGESAPIPGDAPPEPPPAQPAPKPESLDEPEPLPLPNEAGRRPTQSDPAARNDVAPDDNAGKNEAAAPPSYLIIPAEDARRAALDVRFQDQPPDPARIDPATAKTERTVYPLQPMWHPDVARYFEPVAGRHVFAVIHPVTSRTVCIDVDLPDGRPVIKVDDDELEFDYGRLEVEVKFRKNGGVEIEYDD